MQLDHELGIPVGSIGIEDFQLITRIHYIAGGVLLRAILCSIRDLLNMINMHRCVRDVHCSLLRSHFPSPLVVELWWPSPLVVELWWRA